LFVGWGFAPDLTGGAYSAPPDLLALFRGPSSRGSEYRGRGQKEEGSLSFVLGRKKKSAPMAALNMPHNYMHSNICKLAKSVNESEVVAQPD